MQKLSDWASDDQIDAFMADEKDMGPVLVGDPKEFEETKMTFKPGDLVRLRTGGPKMTVSSVSVMNSGTVNTQWFQKVGDDWQLRDGQFSVESLETATRDFSEGQQVPSSPRLLTENDDAG